jgi:phosphatidylserine/phosphatidylglycerophosphate/cardiolipin synthase-like enzyme
MAREKRETDALGNFGSLHAKCALADEEVLLVSSANLTDHALALNMEMGLLVQGGELVSQVRRHFMQMIAQGILTLV